MKYKLSPKVKKIIDDMNAKYSLIIEDGKTFIWYESHDEELDRISYQKMSRDAFIQFYEDERVRVFDMEEERPCSVNLAEIWLKSDGKKKYSNGTVFDPNPDRVDNPNVLNLWKGWAVEPKKGNWSIIDDHIFKVVCASNPTLYNYTLGWLAKVIQQPHNQVEVALILRGEKGCGKGIFGHFIRNLFSNAGLHINNACHLIGRFNTHLRTTAFLFVDEAIWAGNHEHENILKTLVTDTTLTIEEKHGSVRNRRNRLSILMCSNNEWVIPASKDERRYCVLDVNGEFIGNRAYMTALHQATQDKEVQAAFLYEMLNMDLSRYEIRDIPETKGLSDQRAQSLPSIGQWWMDVLEREKIYYPKHAIDQVKAWYEVVSVELLWLSYSQYCEEMRVRSPQNRVELGKFMSKIYEKKRTRELLIIGEEPAKRHEPAMAIYSKSSEQTYCYKIGTVEQAKNSFSTAMKIQLPSPTELID